MYPVVFVVYFPLLADYLPVNQSSKVQHYTARPLYCTRHAMTILSNTMALAGRVLENYINIPFVQPTLKTPNRCAILSEWRAKKCDHIS